MKDIYCGGYITKFLKGFEIFQDPDSTVKGIPSPKISDGPFCSWDLVKLIDMSSPSRFTTPPRGTSTPTGASSSLDQTELQLLRSDFNKERSKNKKFKRVV